MNVKRRFIGCSLFLLSFSHAAWAQEVNYGALTEMFGEPVTTSATGSPQTQSQAPADMQIISSDEIRRSGAQSIPEILRFVAGIDVRTYGAIDSEVSIRGFSQVNNPRLLVLINGRQVYIDDYGYTAWQALPVQLADIRQIEIVRGPASALFGFNATSGVINIITYDPLFDKINTLSFGIGTNGTYEGSLVSTLDSSGKGGITVQLGGLKTNEYNTDVLGGRSARYDQKPQEGSYAIDGRYKPTPNTEVTLEVTQSQATSPTATPSSFYLTTFFRNNSVKAGFYADTGIGTLSLLAYTNKVTTAYDTFAVPPGNVSNQISVIQATDLVKVADAHALRFSMEFRNNRAYGALINGTTGYRNYAASLMWNWQIRSNLSFTAAGRIDHLELYRNDPLPPNDQYTLADFAGRTATVPTYNLGLVWEPTENDTIRVLTGRAVQVPSLLDYGFAFDIPAGPFKSGFLGDPYLKPSITTNYEVDYDRAIARFESALHVAVFYNVDQDLLANPSATAIVFAPPIYLNSYGINDGHGTSAGGELGLQGQDASGWRWNLSYSLVSVSAKLNEGPPAAGLAFNNATPVSELDFGLARAWGNWEAAINGKWQSNYQDTKFVVNPQGGIYTLADVSSFITFNARLAYAVNDHLTLAAIGQQLAQQQTVETYGLEPQRRFLFTAVYNF